MGKVDPPRDLEVHVLRADAPELVLISFEASAAPTLTTVECGVAIAIARGLSNAEIAAERGVALRTVANQVASVFAKLDVSSRAELAAKLTVAHLR